MLNIFASGSPTENESNALQCNCTIKYEISQHDRCLGKYFVIYPHNMTYCSGSPYRTRSLTLKKIALLTLL